MENGTTPKLVHGHKNIPVQELTIDLDDKYWTVKITFAKDRIKFGENLVNDAIKIIQANKGKLYNISEPFTDRVNVNNWAVIIKYVGKANYFTNEKLK